MRWTEDQYKEFLKRSAAPTQSKQKVLLTDGNVSNVRGWRTIGGKKYFFKSLWEVNFAHFSEWEKQQGLIIEWEYEPELFSFPKNDYRAGPFYYRPDFKKYYTGPAHRWFEVKGFMNPASKKKIKRFNKHYAKREGEIILIDGTWFKDAFKKGLNKMIPNWESLPK